MVPIICRSHRACLKGVLEAVNGGHEETLASQQ